jgi:peroxiredoxin Q/BCP
MSQSIAPGQKAPAFVAKDQNEQNVALKDYLGKKVALFFYPKDNTPGCTTQACNLRDNIALLKSKGIEVIGVSIDSSKSHNKFAHKHQLPFTLIADEEQKLVNQYGVWGLKKFMGREFMGTHRTTFLINEQGIIDHIIEKVDTKNHAAQIIELWDDKL